MPSSKTLKLRKKKTIKFRKKAPNLKRKIKRVKHVHRLVSIILIISILFSIYKVLTSSYFNIAGININGLTRYNKEDVLEEINLKVGQNWFKWKGFNIDDIFTLKNKKAQESIIQGRYFIKDAIVELDLPNIVNVDILEREPEFKLKVNDTEDTWLIMDNELFILDIEKPEDLDYEKLILVEGYNLTGYNIGEYLKVNEFQSKVFVEVTNLLRNSDKSFDLKLLPILTYIKLMGNDEIGFIFDDILAVKVGKIKNLDGYLLNFIRTVYSQNILKHEQKTLDFTKGLEPILIDGLDF